MYVTEEIAFVFLKIPTAIECVLLFLTVYYNNQDLLYMHPIPCPSSRQHHHHLQRTGCHPENNNKEDLC